jgi:P-type Ca2+ transporter type 2A
MEDAHAKTVEEVLKHFSTNPELGLTPEQIKQYQAKYGPNGKLKSKILYQSYQSEIRNDYENFV